MDLLSFSITSMCAGSGMYLSACNHALNAGSVQSHIKENYQKTERMINGHINTQTRKYIHRNIIKAGTSVFLVYDIVRKRKISFSVPTLGICDRASTDLGTESVGLNLGWSFK